MTKRGKSELLWRILVAHNIIEMLEDTDDPARYIFRVVCYEHRVR